MNKAFWNATEMNTNCSTGNSCENRFEKKHARIQAIYRETVKVPGSVRDGNKVANIIAMKLEAADSLKEEQ